MFFKNNDTKKIIINKDFYKIGNDVYWTNLKEFKRIEENKPQVKISIPDLKLDVDGESFEIIHNKFAKDKNHIYNFYEYVFAQRHDSYANEYYFETTDFDVKTTKVIDNIIITDTHLYYILRWGTVQIVHLEVDNFHGKELDGYKYGHDQHEKYKITEITSQWFELINKYYTFKWTADERVYINIKTNQGKFCILNNGEALKMESEYKESIQDELEEIINSFK